MKPKPQCGTALILNSKTQLSDVMHCLLDRTPRHTFHLLMDPLQAQRLGVEERSAVIAKFFKLTDPTKSEPRKKAGR